MGLTWAAPQALWLLLVLPFVWMAPLVARTNFNRRQRWLQTVVRSLLLVALTLALARPVVSTSSARQSIVYLVDVSHSVSSRALETAAAKIDALNAATRPGHSRIIVFGATATAVESTAVLRRLAQADTGTPAADPVDRRGSDLEVALDTARSELAPGHVPRIVLFSDGRPTAGDEASAIARLALERIPVSIEPLAPRSLGDTWVDTLDLPERITADATFTATVGIGSQREGLATVELRSGTKLLATRSAPVSKGFTAVALDVSVDAAGSHALEATVTVPDDPLVANNTLDRAVWVDAHAKVLYVEGVPASARYLSGALNSSGFDVTQRPPSGLPSTVAGLDPWDVVVLSDVKQAAIAPASMSALTDWVEKGGGGLLVAGGEAVFGEGGYRKTPIEHLTPVTFERKDQPEVALVLVLDRSWSMAGSSIDLCKAAAQAAVDVMTDEQSIGVLTFNDKFDWDVTLRNVGKNRDVIRKKIAAIEPGGHTLIFPAVEQAYLALRPTKARAKHVILLSDGRSYPADYETLVKKMTEARITVSTVAVGPSADPELLRDIAKWGKGRPYVVADAKEVPQIFVKEAKNAMTPAFDEKTITPIVKTPAFLSGVDLTHVPSLKGRTATVLKDSALEVLGTDDEDPLLAFWPIGLGRTAVFASDVKDRWAANWVTWRGYGPFFASVVRAVARQRPPAVALDVTAGPIHGQTRSIAIVLEAREPTGAYRDLLHPTVQVSQGTRPATTVSLRQVAPGRYEATLVADASQPISVTTAGSESGVTSRVVVPDGAAEYRFRPADEGLLRSMAAATGGTWQPNAAALANAAGDLRTERRPVWPGLIAIALGLWFVDLLLRRVRLFEPSVD
jgi:Ca-activated chloride channel family protein